jgi:hypothetical protein
MLKWKRNVGAGEEADEDKLENKNVGGGAGQVDGGENIMRFTVVTRKGKKPQVCHNVPADFPLISHFFS